MSAVAKDGSPLPWYTYPSIDFLSVRDYKGKSVLEFGAGQSTLWWAARAEKVIALEGDKDWYENIRKNMPSNVELLPVSMESKAENVNTVRAHLDARLDEKFDVIVIDGLHRFEMIEFAINRLNNGGVIICDNAEGYGFYEGFKASDFLRVDFFGNAPGVVLPHSTSLFFKSDTFIFDAKYPIPVISDVR